MTSGPDERPHEPGTVVVDIDGDVDVVFVPGDIIDLVERGVRAEERRLSLEVIALYLARLGETGASEVRRVLSHDAGYFARLPEDVVDLLRNHPERLDPAHARP